MTNIFLSGHRDFGNRGCEAIVRGTVSVVGAAIPNAVFIVPSTDIERDRELWPDAEMHGVKFYKCASYSFLMRVWAKIRKKVPILNTVYPLVPLPKLARKLIDSSDIVLSVGGDNYSEDYSLPFLPILFDRYAIKRKKPLVLWGASVGPFESNERYKRFISNHLGSFSYVFVRESRSFEYCKNDLALDNLKLFSDPAFCMSPEDLPDDPTIPVFDSGSGVVGFNLSPVILKRMPGRVQSFTSECVSLLEEINKKFGFGVLLVPHVMAYKGNNNDILALNSIYDELHSRGIPVSILPESLNAPQIKSAIAKCNVFIGARTHSTIAAISTTVPTISIGYSVKAIGINEQIFGNDHYVVNYSSFNRDSVINLVFEAMSHQKDLFSNVLDDVRTSSRSAGEEIHKLLKS